MASRLSELLDRIRPAGTPGAPSDVISQRRQATAGEIAELSMALSRFDDEADGIIADARVQADRARADAERRVEEIRADLPDRIAVAESSGLRSADDGIDDEVARVSAESEREIERLRSQAEPRLALLVDEAVSVVWALLPSPGERTP